MNTLQANAPLPALPADLTRALARVLEQVRPLSENISKQLETVQPIMDEIVAALDVPLPEVADEEIMLAVAEESKNVRRLWMNAEAVRKTLVTPINDAKQVIQDFFNPFLQSLELREKKCDALVINFKAAKERIRRAMEEKMRADTEAEQKRLRELAARKAKEVAKTDPMKAEQIVASVPTVPVPIVPKDETKIDGMIFKLTWKARILDDALVPREWCTPDQSKLDKLAASNGPKEEGKEHPLQGKVPGVEFYSTTGTIKKVK